MKVTLLHNSPLWLASNAIRMSHNNHDKSDTIHIGKDGEPVNDINNFYSYSIIGEKDKALIDRVGNKLKHKSILEQLVYWFEIDGISRGCLQELARHRTARLTVKSTRYTLNELRNIDTIMYYTADKWIVMTDDDRYNRYSILALQNVQEMLKKYPVSNDIAKHSLPEAFKTKLQWQIDGRNLQNFLELRTAKDAHWEIRKLAYAIYDNLPEEHQYLYIRSLK